MHLAACILLLRMIDELMEVSLQRPIATGRVGRQPTARLDREVGRLLYGLDGKILDRLHDDSPVTAHPRDHGRPILVIMALAWLALLAATTRPTSQMLFAPLFRLPLVPSGVIEFIRFDGTLQVAIRLVGQGGVTQPPGPAVAGADTNA